MYFLKRFSSQRALKAMMTMLSMELNADDRRELLTQVLNYKSDGGFCIPMHAITLLTFHSPNLHIQ